MKTHLDGDILAVGLSQLLFKVEILEGKFLVVGGESAKFAKLLPLQNFVCRKTCKIALSLSDFIVHTLCTK